MANFSLLERSRCRRSRSGRHPSTGLMLQSVRQVLWTVPLPAVPLPWACFSLLLFWGLLVSAIFAILGLLVLPPLPVILVVRADGGAVCLATGLARAVDPTPLVTGQPQLAVARQV